MDKAAPAKRYINRIRNDAKRRYARLYLGFLAGQMTTEPTRPAGLSFMAAQAVRHQLSRLYRP